MLCTVAISQLQCQRLPNGVLQAQQQMSQYKDQVDNLQQNLIAINNKLCNLSQVSLINFHSINFKSIVFQRTINIFTFVVQYQHMNVLNLCNIKKQERF